MAGECDGRVSLRYADWNGRTYGDQRTVLGQPAPRLPCRGTVCLVHILCPRSRRTARPTVLPCRHQVSVHVTGDATCSHVAAPTGPHPKPRDLTAGLWPSVTIFPSVFQPAQPILCVRH